MCTTIISLFIALFAIKLYLNVYDPSVVECIKDKTIKFIAVNNDVVAMEFHNYDKPLHFLIHTNSFNVTKRWFDVPNNYNILNNATIIHINTIDTDTCHDSIIKNINDDESLECKLVQIFFRDFATASINIFTFKAYVFINLRFTEVSEWCVEGIIIRSSKIMAQCI